ncbi:MAG TPA: chloride channel protein, partial [Dyella sp.]
MLTDKTPELHSRAALPLAPSMDATLAAAHMPRQFRPLGRRVLWIAGLAMILGAVVALVARALTALIGLVTNLAFHGRWSTDFSSPA